MYLIRFEGCEIILSASYNGGQTFLGHLCHCMKFISVFLKTEFEKAMLSFSNCVASPPPLPHVSSIVGGVGEGLSKRS